MNENVTKNDNYNIKFKAFESDSTTELENCINDFIKDKLVIDVKLAAHRYSYTAIVLYTDIQGGIRTNNKFENMNHEEFINYCEARARDGQWSINEALLCLGIIEHLYNIKIRTFIFYNKKKTKKAREDEWNMIKECIFKEGL